MSIVLRELTDEVVEELDQLARLQRIRHPLVAVHLHSTAIVSITTSGCFVPLCESTYLVPFIAKTVVIEEIVWSFDRCPNPAQEKILKDCKARSSGEVRPTAQERPILIPAEVPLTSKGSSCVLYSFVRIRATDLYAIPFCPLQLFGKLSRLHRRYWAYERSW